MSDFPLLLCPDTLPAPADCRALLFLADCLAYYRPLADDPQPADLAALEGTGLCHGHTPVSLGSHLARFRQLLHEMGQAGSEFYGGSLDALARSRQPHPEEAAVWSLVTRMRQQGNGTPDAEQELETVWNALLLLKLAERYLAEEQEVAAYLASVNRQQAALFEELKGDEDFAAHLTALQAEEQATASLLDQEKLLKAWGQLFLRDSEKHPLLALSHPGPAMLLLDLAASLSDARPLALCSLPVPTLEGNPFADAHHQWRTSEAGLLNELRTLLLTFAREGVIEPERCQALAREWEQAHQRRFGGQPHRLLTISALPGASLASLFSRLTRGSNKKGHGGFPHGLLVHFAEPAA